MTFINGCPDGCSIGCKKIPIFFWLVGWVEKDKVVSKFLLAIDIFFSLHSLSLTVTFPCDKLSHLTSHHYTINKSIFDLQSNKLQTDLNTIQKIKTTTKNTKND